MHYMGWVERFGRHLFDDSLSNTLPTPLLENIRVILFTDDTDHSWSLVELEYPISKASTAITFEGQDFSVPNGASIIGRC
jgi:hypothetical protein